MPSCDRRVRSTLAAGVGEVGAGGLRVAHAVSATSIARTIVMRDGSPPRPFSIVETLPPDRFASDAWRCSSAVNTTLLKQHFTDYVAVDPRVQNGQQVPFVDPPRAMQFCASSLLVQTLPWSSHDF